ncbi:MAG: MFS transporter [Actinobacteria bacterium]|nr:MFS transporter [Actinomycetota bacterium]
MNRSIHPHFNPWLALVVVCFGQFMVVLDATIVNVALPAIQTDLGFSDSSLQWVVNAYTLLFGGFLLLGGRAADLLGRRTLFLAGVALFSLASLANGLATTEGMLIAGRAAQGLGGALLSPAALSVITTSFGEGAERTKALSVWAAVAAGGGAVGLLLGGFLVESFSWEWIFFVNVPVGIAIIFAALRLVPNSRHEGALRHFDLAGASSVTGGLIVLVYAIVEASNWGWGSAKTLGVAAVGVALLAAFIAIERRSPAPLVRLSLFRLRSLSTANGVFLLVAGGLFAMFFFASLYLQDVLGYSPLTTGLAFLPVTVGIAGGATIAQQLIPRVGLRPVLLTGMLLASAGLATLAATTEVGGSYLGVLGGLLPMSVGMGATFVSLTLVATTNVETSDAGLASGIFNTSQQVGGALGLAVLSSIASSRSASFLSGIGGQPTPLQGQEATVVGFQTAFIVAAALVAAGTVLTALLLRRRDVALIDGGETVPVPAA